MNYRAEIDGLRSIAVLPVILFHAGFEIFSGGFVGVDVFFVISGYLITSILISDIKQGNFSLVKFYERRARRILPALFFVMAASIPFAWMWLLPQDLKDFAQSLMAVPVFSSNILFLSESGYFDTQTDLKPLLHTWSLAVEEQYYLLFPLLLMACWKFGKRWVFAILIGLTLASLILSDVGSTYKPSATFYLLPTRLWEILLGSLLALYAHDNDPLVSNRTITEISSLAGLSLIIYSIFIFDEQTPFPSFYTLVPTIGTVMVIHFARPKTSVARILGNKFLVSMGLISYSAYLWHQPLFAFVKYRTLSPPSHLTMGVLSALVIPLAYFTWRYVEKPFRNKSSLNQRTIFTLTAIGSVVFIAIGLSGELTKGFKDRAQIRNLAVDIKTINNSYCHTKGRRSIQQITDGNFCSENNKRKSVALIGDSHASALSSELSTAFAKQDTGLWIFSSGWCAPLLNFSMMRKSKDCAERQTVSLHQISSDKDIQTVILFAEWPIYTKGFRGKDTPSRVKYNSTPAVDISDNPALFRRALNDTVAYLKAANKNVVIITSTPEFPVHVIKTLQRAQLFDTPLEAPSITSAEYHQRNKEISESFKSIEGVTYISGFSLFCENERCNSVTKAGKPLFSDTNHITEYGARLIANTVIKKLTTAQVNAQK